MKSPSQPFETSPRPPTCTLLYSAVTSTPFNVIWIGLFIEPLGEGGILGSGLGEIGVLGEGVAGGRGRGVPSDPFPASISSGITFFLQTVQLSSRLGFSG